MDDSLQTQIADSSKIQEGRKEAETDYSQT